MVIPTIPKDFNKISYNFKFYKKYINGINNFVFIGDEKVEKLIRDQKSFFEIPLTFINEKNLIDVDKIKNLIKNRNIFAIKRSGWYIQQFLKMQYCKICKDKYYLIWDSDTIPVKEVKMFNNYGKPYFDVRREYNKPYFNTMKKVFHNLRKTYRFSFISEHMLIKTDIMKILINRININHDISGKTWYEKIINCIEKEALVVSGFSEFETYGTFVNEYYRKIYSKRLWKSVRLVNSFNNPIHLNDNDLKNLAKNSYAVSFENWN